MTYRIPDTTDVLINGIFGSCNNGTGTWTRAVIAALPEVRVWKPALDPVATGRMAFYKKAAYEAGMRKQVANLVFHPYWGMAVDRRAVITALDLIGFDRAPAVHRSIRLLGLKRAAAVCTISRHMQSDLLTRLNIESMLATPHPDPVFFQDVVPEPTVHRIRIGYWGGFHSRKGLQSILAAARGFAGYEMEFVVAGQRPAHFEDFGQRVSFRAAGTADDLAALIDSTNIAIYPSLDEGYGLPVQEALLRGKPILVRPLPAYADIVRGSSGLHFIESTAPADVHALLKAAIEGARGSALRDSLIHPTFESAQSTLAGQLEAVLASALRS